MKRRNRLTLIIQVSKPKSKDGSAVTECYQNSLGFPRVKRRAVEVNFEGGEVTSDGGILLLRSVDRQIGLTESLDRAIKDPRVQ